MKKADGRKGKNNSSKIKSKSTKKYSEIRIEVRIKILYCVTFKSTKHQNVFKNFQAKMLVKWRVS